MFSIGVYLSACVSASVPDSKRSMQALISHPQSLRSGNEGIQINCAFRFKIYTEEEEEEGGGGRGGGGGGGRGGGGGGRGEEEEEEEEEVSK